jgi:hypothetical protein
MNLETAFMIGALWGERYQSLYDRAGLNDSLGIGYEDLHTAAKGGAGILGEDANEKPLLFGSVAFANVKQEILKELVLHIAQKQELLNLIRKDQTKLF